MNYKIWSDYEVQILKEKCSTGNYSYSMIGKLLDRDYISCQNKAKQLKINNPFKSAKKYTTNLDFWNPNPISAYWAGFSAADASINKHSLNCYNYRLEIANSDISHLEQFKKDAQYNGPIKTCVRRDKFLHSRLVVSEPKWIKDLEKYYNIVPNKTLRLAPPNLNNEYLNFCYLIGYIDGDGTIFFDKNKNTLTIRIVSGSQDIIEWCHKLLFLKFENSYLRKKKNKVNLSVKKYPVLNIGGIRAAVIFDFLSKFDVPKLQRKWNNPDILNYVNSIKSLHPQFFI
jgi:hypothetical protein